MAEDSLKEQSEGSILTRRYFLETIGGGAIGIVAAGSAVLTGQFLSPNVLREPPLKFRAGPTENFPPESVTLNKEQKVFIVRAKEGYFSAVSAVCTHLGCITNWKSEEEIIACPCHGSKFDKEGNVLEGPAPRPLPRFAMTLDEQGQLVVDKGVMVGEEVILKV
ncbi:MAG: ubiquinol-cytochrome c reductase iron-sulfur subunit [Ignavibacteriales bacterium]|nr:ubiquinol-cytochrome c reductase iron-sulfur subunit [Ignavibacteriales bacterium]